MRIVIHIRARGVVVGLTCLLCSMLDSCSTRSSSAGLSSTYYHSPTKPIMVTVIERSKPVDNFFLKGFVNYAYVVTDDGVEFPIGLMPSEKLVPGQMVEVVPIYVGRRTSNQVARDFLPKRGP